MSNTDLQPPEEQGPHNHDVVERETKRTIILLVALTVAAVAVVVVALIILGVGVFRWL